MTKRPRSQSAAASQSQSRRRDTYAARMTVGGLRLRDCRVLAGLLLEDLPQDQLRKRLYEDDALQLGNPGSISRVLATLRPRLSHLGSAALEGLVEGSVDEGHQVLMAATLWEDRLFRDFFVTCFCELLRRHQDALAVSDWATFLSECEARSEVVEGWAPSTRKGLRQGVYSVLVEAGYLQDARSRRLQRVPMVASVSGMLNGCPASGALDWMAWAS